MHGVGRGVKGEPTSCYYLVGRGTIEEDLCSLLQKKADIISATLDGGERDDNFEIYDQLEQQLLRRVG